MLLKGGQKRYDGNKHKYSKSSAGHSNRPQNPRKSKAEGKLRELRKLRRRLLEAAGEDRQIHDTERMMEYLEDGPEWLDEVPAELFGELIERIIIISPERLKFRLLNGMELAENIERTVR